MSEIHEELSVRMKSFYTSLGKFLESEVRINRDEFASQPLLSSLPVAG